MTLEEIRELLEKATPRPWLTRSDIEIPYDAIFEANIIARRAYHQLREAGPELAALLVRAVEGLQVIRDAGGATTDEGLSCNGTWCAEQARSLLRALEVEA